MIQLEPIGRARTPWSKPGQPPKQGAAAGVRGVIELDQRWAEGLSGLTPGRDLWVICHLDQSRRLDSLMIHPRGDRNRPLTGVFNTRSPNRPCPVSLTLVRLEEIRGNELHVKGLDLVDGTPVLDIKPYLKGLDAPLAADGDKQ